MQKIIPHGYDFYVSRGEDSNTKGVSLANLDYLNHSLRDFVQPIKRSNANGAPQLAQRSTKSQTCMPTIGRSSAVQKPQNAIHKRMTRTGLIKMKIANIISTIPRIKSNWAAISGSEMPNFATQPIQSFLPCNAKTPWPINSPATAIRKTHSAILRLLIIVLVC